MPTAWGKTVTVSREGDRHGVEAQLLRRDEQREHQLVDPLVEVAGQASDLRLVAVADHLRNGRCVPLPLGLEALPNPPQSERQNQKPRGQLRVDHQIQAAAPRDQQRRQTGQIGQRARDADEIEFPQIL